MKTHHGFPNVCRGKRGPVTPRPGLTNKEEFWRGTVSPQISQGLWPVTKKTVEGRGRGEPVSAPATRKKAARSGGEMSEAEEALFSISKKKTQLKRRGPSIVEAYAHIFSLF